MAGSVQRCTNAELRSIKNGRGASRRNFSANRQALNGEGAAPLPSDARLRGLGIPQA
jgi:hypothetical protein